MLAYSGTDTLLARATNRAVFARARPPAQRARTANVFVNANAGAVARDARVPPSAVFAYILAATRLAVALVATVTALDHCEKN